MYKNDNHFISEWNNIKTKTKAFIFRFISVNKLNLALTVYYIKHY